MAEENCASREGRSCSLEKHSGGEARKDQTQFRILAFGDSLTEGWIDDGANFRPYTARLQKLLDELATSNSPGNSAASRLRSFAVDNKGLSGEFVLDQMITRLPEVLKAVKLYDLVIILGGTNDLSEASLGDEEKIFEGLTQLHDLAKQHGAQSVIVTLPETDVQYKDMGQNGTSYVKQSGENVRMLLNEKLRFYSTRTKTCLCDLAARLPQACLTPEELDKYWDDGLHFTEAGYERMAEIIFEAIKAMII